MRQRDRQSIASPGWRGSLWGLLIGFGLLVGCRSADPPDLGRFGVCAEYTPELASQLDALGPVWYYDYHYRGPDVPGHPRLLMTRSHPADPALREALERNPAAWLAVGNEPNDPNQDFQTPEEYARLYHDVYQYAKRIDRRCRIIPAGFADADWRWANEFREHYLDLYGEYPPVDGWNLHNYILDGDAYDVDEFQRRIVAFRHWMMSIGEGDKPLFLTEFGVLYGAGCCERPIDPPEKTVEFMRESVAWLAETDYVQHWAWFIVNNAGDFNGGLFDANGHMTLYGQTYRELIERYSAAP